MFDSRSDHPHKGVHHVRHNNGEFHNREHFARVPKPTLPKQAAIREALADTQPEVNRAFLAHGLRTAARNRFAAMSAQQRAALDERIAAEQAEAFVASIAYWADLYR